MSSPVPMNISCCSPATTESVAVVRDKIADSRSDLLVGQGTILKSQGDYTSAILQDVSASGANTNSNVDRLGLATMAQIDKYGISGIHATHHEGDKLATQLDIATRDLATEVGDKADKHVHNANTIAWAQESNAGHRFGELRNQNERINDAQSAYSDRAFKYNSMQNSDNFSRLGTAVTNSEKQTLHSQMGLERSLNAGFTDINAFMRDSSARLGQQHCDIKSSIAAAQLAAAESFCETKRDVLLSAKELGIQAAQNFGAVQVEASKNTAAIQFQSALNQKESLLEQSKWFALAEKTAMLNKCEIEAKLAACCCEIKETVSTTAAATQSLIQSNESARLRDALTNATTENAILRLSHGGGGRH